MSSLRSYFYRAVEWTRIIDKDGKDTLLQHAAMSGRTNAVKAWLEAGADVHAQNDLALRLAAFWGRTDAVRALLEGCADVHAMNDEPLRWAKEAHRTDTIKTLEDWIVREQERSPTAPREKKRSPTAPRLH